MASHSIVVESSLSVEDAYARLADLERVPEWDEGVRSSVKLEGDEPRFDVTVTGFDGEPSSVVYEITEASAPDRFVMVDENDVFRAVDTLVLAADSMFPKIAAVAESGLTTFLNP